MTTSKDFTISLPTDMAEVVEDKILAGAYGSVSDMVRDGLHVLLDREVSLDRWLRDDVMVGHQEYLEDPTKGVPADAVLERIRARRAGKDQTSF